MLDLVASFVRSWRTQPPCPLESGASPRKVRRHLRRFDRRGALRVRLCKSYWKDNHYV